MKVALGRLAAVVALVAGPSCALPFEAGDDDLLFVTLAVEPNAHMEALFDGRVILDEAGCLRLGTTSEAAMVVWPHGARLDRSTLEVRARDGRLIGRIGERFRFGGGFVASLHDGIPVADRDRVMARCPGSFWIVGDVLTPR